MTDSPAFHTLLAALALCAGAALCAFVPAPAAAAPITPQIFDFHKKSCTAPIARQERLQGIPNQLLAAVSLAESGRWDSKASASFAWPWTVTAEGKGQFFASKTEAVAHVKSLRTRGIRNIDVGCMQVNLHYHPDAFPDIETALEPESNVAYAARYLKSLFDDKRSWIAAVGNYHSATPEFHFRYRAKVVHLWNDTRRRGAEEKRQNAIAAYQERRAGQLAARGLAAADASAPNTSGPVMAPAANGARPALNRVTATTTPTISAPSLHSRPVPVGQTLPRQVAVPLLRR